MAPHEEKMRRAGLEFDSPLLEMHEEIAHNRTRVLEQRQKFLRKDKEELVDKEAMGIVWGAAAGGWRLLAGRLGGECGIGVWRMGCCSPCDDAACVCTAHGQMNSDMHTCFFC